MTVELRSIAPPFVPHRLLRCPHRQTIASVYLWRRYPYDATSHTIDLADGDQLIVHDDRPAQWQLGMPTAMLVHGLGGCHESGYVNRLAAKLQQRSVRVFRLDMRGCGAGAATAKASLHAGRSGDLRAAAEWIHAACPSSPLTVVGFSLGAAILLKLLGEMGSQGPAVINDAIAVSPPLDLAECSRSLPNGVNRLYDYNFARILARMVEQRRRVQPDLLDRPWQRRPRTLLDFDKQFTAPLGGFESVEHYYAACSPQQFLATIEVPTRIVTAKDDPLIPARLFHEATYSASTEILATDHGGHLGFLAAKNSDPDWHWLDWRIVEWIAHGSASQLDAPILDGHNDSRHNLDAPTHGSPTVRRPVAGVPKT